MIVVLGDINLDITAPLAAPPVLGQDCVSSELAFQCGGVGVNTAIMLAHLGAEVRLIGCAGKDWFGDLVLKRVQGEGIDTEYVQRREGTLTGLMYIVVSPDGQRTIFGSRGANAEVRAEALFAKSIERAEALVLFGYSFLSQCATEAAEQLLHTAKSQGTLVALDVGEDPSRRVPEKVLQAAREADVVLANGVEAAGLTGYENVERAFKTLAQTGAGEVTLKLGGEGCLIEEGGQPCRVPPFAVRAVDTTGAGDAFTAAYVMARVQKWPKVECALFANAAGAAAATTMGAGERMPRLNDVRQLVKASSLPKEWDEVRERLMVRLHGATAAIRSRGA